MDETGGRGWKQFMLRHYIHDWIILIALAILELNLLLVIHPFRRYVDQYWINDLRFPIRDFTVSLPLLVVISCGVPIVVFLVFFYFKRDKRDLHQAFLSLWFSVIIGAVITDSLKNLTGRPRPDFFWRCFPDGVAHFKPNGDVACTGKSGEIRQGYKSFPSGHSSWSFGGLGFLAWYLADRVHVGGHRAHVFKVVIVSLPLIVATLVAISIMNDYWHHWSDVIAGIVIGLAVSTLCYRQRFPRPGTDYAKDNVLDHPSHDLENGTERRELNASSS